MEAMKKIRTYSELITLPTFKERYEYLRLGDRVGEATFGFDRYLNQKFYKSREWQDIRYYVITRDYCRDLAFEDRDIPDGVKVLIHHMNPMVPKDIVLKEEWILDPEYLVCTTKRTHDAIHYGDESLLYSDPVERFPNDTCLWR